MPQQGKAISTGQKLCVISLKSHYDLEKKSGATVLTKNPTLRIAKGLNIGRRTIQSILSEYRKNDDLFVEKPLKTRGKPPFNLSNTLVPNIRHYIRERNLQGQHVSVRNIRAWLIQEHQADIPITTLWRAFNRMGFSYGTGKRRSALKERDYVISARRKYLRKKIWNRKKDGTLKRPEVYLDETYINKNHSSDSSWFLESDGPWVNKPAGKGERLIIVNAITANGWVSGAKLVFQAKRKTGDYHGQMNYDNFSKWFTEQLLPNIPDKSIIIMDNAKYHNILADDTFPTPRSRKEELQRWIETNRPALKLERDLLKPELYEICKKEATPPQFKLDEIAEKNGHTILRTPQYHCELQPIENCWGVVKNYCRDHCEFTMSNLKEHLPIGFSKVTKRTCQKVIAKVYEQENTFWLEDSEIEKMQQAEELDYSNEAYFDPEDYDREIV